jgi:hypothetical protein
VSLYPPAGTTLLTPYTKQVDFQAQSKLQSEAAKRLAKLLGDKYELGRNQLDWLSKKKSLNISLTNVDGVSVYRPKVGCVATTITDPSAVSPVQAPDGAVEGKVVVHAPKLLLSSGVCAYVPEVVTEYRDSLVSGHGAFVVGDLQ